MKIQIFFTSYRDQNSYDPLVIKHGNVQIHHLELIFPVFRRGKNPGVPVAIFAYICRMIGPKLPSGKLT